MFTLAPSVPLPTSTGLAVTSDSFCSVRSVTLSVARRLDAHFNSPLASALSTGVIAKNLDRDLISSSSHL